MSHGGICNLASLIEPGYPVLFFKECGSVDPEEEFDWGSCCNIIRGLATTWSSWSSAEAHIARESLASCLYSVAEVLSLMGSVAYSFGLELSSSTRWTWLANGEKLEEIR